MTLGKLRHFMNQWTIFNDTCLSTRCFHLLQWAPCSILQINDLQSKSHLHIKHPDTTLLATPTHIILMQHGLRFVVVTIKDERKLVVLCFTFYFLVLDFLLHVKYILLKTRLFPYGILSHSTYFFNLFLLQLLLTKLYRYKTTYFSVA